MFKKLEYKYFIWFSIVLLLGTIGIWYSTIYSGNSKGYETYTLFIKNEIVEEISIAEKELDLIKGEYYTSNQNFTSLLKLKIKYPVFIFKKDELIFWSDNKVVPKYSVLQSIDKIQFVQLPTGKCIVVKEKIDSTVSFYSIIPLTYEYSINNNYLSSGNNDEIFNHENVEINNFHVKGDYAVSTNNGIYLFSLNFAQAKSISDDTFLFSLLLFSFIAVVCFLIGLFYKVNQLVLKRKVIGAILLLLFFLLFIRLVMLYLNFPYSLVPIKLFNSKYFAISEISPSMGDLFLNILFLSFFSWFVLKNYSKSSLIKFVIAKYHKLSFIFGVLLSGISLAILFYLSYIFSEIYSNSQFSLDITQDINLSLFKIVSMIIFILVCGIFFIYNHIALRIYILILGGKKTIVKYLPILIVALFSEIIIIAIGEKNWILIPVNFVFWVALIYFSLPKNIGTLKYSTYLYFLITAFVCSFTGAINLYYVNAEKNLIEKYKYSSQLLNENDLFAEYLLAESMGLIEKDKFILTRFKSIFSSKELIVQKIIKVILPEYLEKYEVHVSVFDSEGNVLIQNSDYVNYYEAKETYAKDTFQTDHKGVYLVQEINNSPLKRYMTFKELFEEGELVGSVVLELVHKKNSPHSVYPELLVDKKYITPRQFNTFQYGIYDPKLILSKGNFNYEKFYNDSLLNKKRLYNEGIDFANYHHLGIKAKDGKIIVISSDSYSLINILSNFSFLFFLLLIFVLLFVAGYIYYYQYKSVHLNYASKILVYLNVAFFLPLVIVSIVTLSLISNYYKNSQNKSFVKKAEGLSVTILNHLESYQDDPFWESKLENDIAQLASFTGTDINLFNKNGALLYSYHPAIYERSLLSKQLNPDAYFKITQEGANEIMLNESLGKLKYNTVYIPIKSYKNSELLGILSIPFFESREELNKQLIGIFTTTLNIFSVIFIVFAGLSYFASRILTTPLNIITQKIKKTTFGNNIPLDWKSKDEIGLLITEYNSMLSKLEDSRLALSKNEKESAWREMAKQVAHEIKNPLTPMKLKIQYLQRSWKEKNENVVEQTEKGLQSILDQVNILNEIASSFSAFAKMPIPKQEQFDVAEVLKSTVNLYNNTHDVHVDSRVGDEKCIIDGDSQLMGAIFTNLIINAIQSVAFNTLPKVEVKLTKTDNVVKISISDNGIGIPDELIHKVFLPNFSTKETGSGIGLSVAKRGVEHAGGAIWFETELTLGTTFYIEIPLVN